MVNKVAVHWLRPIVNEENISIIDELIKWLWLRMIAMVFHLSNIRAVAVAYNVAIT